MKQNSRPIVGEVPKPTGIGLDELNSTVETFCTSVADFVLAEVEQSLLVTSEHLDNLFDRLQPAAHRVVRPRLEESLGSTLVAVAPELTEVLLDTPGPACLQVELVQSPKRNSFSAATVGILLEPCPFGARQWRCARLGESAVLLLSNRVHRFTEVFGNMKLVVHDVSLGQALFGRTHVRWPHVHGHRFDRRTLRRRERFQQTNGGLKFSLRHQVQYPRAVDVGQDAGVGVPSLGAFLIKAKVPNLIFGAPQHASLHSADHDGIDRAPRQSCEMAYGLCGGAGFKQFDDKAGHHGGDPAVAFGPGHCQFFNRAITVFELGDTGFDEGLKLTGIEVSPLALAPAVDVRPLGRIGRVRPHLPLLQNNFDHHALVRQRQVYPSDRPRCIQSKKLLVQRCVFHVQNGIFEKPDFPRLSEKSQ